MNGSGQAQAKLFFPLLLDGLRYESCDEEANSQRMFISGSARGGFVTGVKPSRR